MRPVLIHHVLFFVQVVLDVDTGEVRTGAGVQEYIRTCNFIWNKQVSAWHNQNLYPYRKGKASLMNLSALAPRHVGQCFV